MFTLVNATLKKIRRNDNNRAIAVKTIMMDSKLSKINVESKNKKH